MSKTWVKRSMTDSALTGRILQLANTGERTTSEPATTVEEAIMRLGSRTVRNLALAFSLVSERSTGSCKTFQYENYWSSSLGARRRRPDPGPPLRRASSGRGLHLWSAGRCRPSRPGVRVRGSYGALLAEHGNGTLDDLREKEYKSASRSPTVKSVG
ncbi:MAG: HDOD domain-containing protein [Planctomycetota bacterium]